MGNAIIVDFDSRIADARLRSLVSKTKDLSEVFRDFAKVYRKFQIELFRSGGADAGGWKPLAPATIARKRKMGYPLDILIQTKTLMRSLTTKTSYTVEDIRPREMTIGSSVPYGQYHQTSTKRMPARPLIVVTDDLRRDWVKLLAKHVGDGV